MEEEGRSGKFGGNGGAKGTGFVKPRRAPREKIKKKKNWKKKLINK